MHQQQKSSNGAHQMMTCSFQLTVSGRHLLCSRASANVKVARAPRHTTMTMAAKLKEILVLSLFCRRQGWPVLGLEDCKSWQMQHWMQPIYQLCKRAPRPAALQQ